MNLDKKLLMAVGVSSAVGGFVGGIAHAALNYMREPHSYKIHQSHDGKHLLEDGALHPGTGHEALHPALHPALHHGGHPGEGHGHDAHGHDSGHPHSKTHKNDASDPSKPAPDGHDEPGHDRQHDDSNTRGAAGFAQPTKYAQYREWDTLPAMEPSLF